MHNSSWTSTAAVCACVAAAPLMLAISLTVFVLLLAAYACFALQALVRQQPSSLRAFFYDPWT